jgi:hypothetical protein
VIARTEGALIALFKFGHACVNALGLVVSVQLADTSDVVLERSVPLTLQKLLTENDRLDAVPLQTCQKRAANVLGNMKRLRHGPSVASGMQTPARLWRAARPCRQKMCSSRPSVVVAEWVFAANAS